MRAYFFNSRTKYKANNSQLILMNYKLIEGNNMKLTEK